jgi:glycosyltransferase involved in cell wall biosynthesis
MQAEEPRVLAFLPEIDHISLMFGKGVGGCSYVRLTGPLAFLRRRGYPVDYIPFSRAREMAKNREGISSYHVYVLPRVADHDNLTIQFVDRLKSIGATIIWETDDDYTNEYRSVVEGEPLSIVTRAHCMTVSTPHLREQYSKYVDCPIYLLQNTINLDFWAGARGPREIPSPSIGLVGTDTHGDDWIHASDALHRIAERYPFVHFVLGGFQPEYLLDLPNLHLLPHCPYIAYPRMVHQIDIGLAPLDGGDKFNLSKSAIKVMEYWAAGATPIASDMPVYQRVADEDRCFLAKSEDDWFSAMATLIENPQRAFEMSANGRAWLHRNRNMEHASQFWWDVYELAHQQYGGTYVNFESERTMGSGAADS